MEKGKVCLAALSKQGHDWSMRTLAVIIVWRAKFLSFKKGNIQVELLQLI